MSDPGNRRDFWHDLIHRVQRERLARECRAAVVRRNLDRAVGCAVQLLQATENATDQANAAMVLARALGEMRNDRRRCDEVLERLENEELFDSSIMTTLRSQYQQYCDAPQQSFEESNQAWLREQNEAIVALRAFLPSINETGQPEDSELAAFRAECEHIFKAAYHRNQAHDLIDAILILSDYCPVDPPAFAKLAGAEDRMFLNLGPKARLTAVRTMVTLGQSDGLRKALLSLASDDELEVDQKRAITAFMGGLRHADFFAYAKECFEEHDDEREENWFAEPLSRLLHPEAPRLLLDRLRELLKKSRDPVYERRAWRMIDHLGRALRINSTIEPEQRNEYTREAIKVIGEKRRELASRAAIALFGGSLENLAPDLREWAAERSIDMMWGKAPTLGGAPPARTENGWREPYVQNLVRLGKPCLPAALRAASRHATQYNGAISAFANTLRVIGDPSAVSLLSDLLRLALLHEDEETSMVQRETVIDPVTGQTHALDRDDLVHTVLFTLQKIGGEQGAAVVLDCADQVQAGRIPNPGTKTAALLMDAKAQAGAHNSAATQAQAIEVDPEALKKAIDEAHGGFFAKAPRRIAALAKLGQMRQLEAIEVIIECLGDKDAMVAGAAHTALAQYLQPLPSETDFSRLLDSILERPKTLKGERLNRLLAFIEREMPKNSPYDSIYERQVAVNLHGQDELIFRFNAAMRKPEPEVKTSEVADPNEETQAEKTELNVKDMGSGRKDLTELDRRRLLLQARREWIAGGKKGPEPKL